MLNLAAHHLSHLQMNIGCTKNKNKTGIENIMIISMIIPLIIINPLFRSSIAVLIIINICHKTLI